MTTIPLQELLAKATPGPLTVTPSGDGKCYVIGDGQSAWGTHVAEVYSDDTDRDEAHANAYLYRHALRHIGPLVEALEAVLRCHYAWVDDQDSEKAHALYVAADRADKALAAAKNVQVGP